MELAESLGVEVRFIDAPSLEGLFTRKPHPLILLPSYAHRPRGRIAFSCAHELGHFALGHAARVDAATSPARKNTDEYAADVFASSLLMPRPAVQSALTRREVSVESAGALELYCAAGELGVGYTTLLQHMTWGLQLGNKDWLRELERVTPKMIRAEIAPNFEGTALALIDDAWRSSFIDLEVGDLLAVSKSLASAIPESVCELVKSPNSSWKFWRASRAGAACGSISQQATQVRVARRGYSGPYKHMFLEDPEQ